MGKAHPFASWFFSQRAGEYEQLHTAVWLLMKLAELADWETGVADYSQSWVARELGVSRYTVMRLQEKLIGAGQLRRHGPGRYGNRVLLLKWGEFKRWCTTRSAAGPESSKGTPDFRPIRGVTELPATCGNSATGGVAAGVADLPHNHVENNHDDHDDKRARIEILWTEHFEHPLTQSLRRSLAALADRYSADRIEAAFKQAARYGGKSVIYVERILERWSKEGFDPKSGLNTRPGGKKEGDNAKIGTGADDRQRLREYYGRAGRKIAVPEVREA